MKRLIRNAEKMQLMHGTDAHSILKILQGGSFNVTSSKDGKYQGVWLTDDYDLSTSYARGDEDVTTMLYDIPNFGVSVEISVDTNNLKPDTDDLNIESSDEKEIIENEDWKSSLNLLHAVIHQGPIDASQIKRVIININDDDMGYINTSGLENVLEEACVYDNMIIEYIYKCFGSNSPGAILELSPSNFVKGMNKLKQCLDSGTLIDDI